MTSVRTRNTERLLNANYILFGGGGTSVTRFNVFRKILSTNPC